MNITELDYLVRTYHFYADRRSYYLEAAKKFTKDYEFLQHVLFSLAFDDDSKLRSLCKDHDIEYEPIDDKHYKQWLGNQYQSK